MSCLFISRFTWSPVPRAELSDSIQAICSLVVEMPTPTKSVSYSPDSYCRVCDQNIRIKGVGRYNIFGSDRNLARRLSQLVAIEVRPSPQQLSNNICASCFRKLEKLEKTLKIINEEIPSVKKQYSSTVSNQVERAASELARGRQKRCRNSPQVKGLDSKRHMSRKPATTNVDVRVKPSQLLPRPLNLQNDKENEIPAWMREVQVNADHEEKKLTSKVEVRKLDTFHVFIPSLRWHA